MIVKGTTILYFRGSCFVAHSSSLLIVIYEVLLSFSGLPFQTTSREHEIENQEESPDAGASRSCVKEDKVSGDCQLYSAGELII